MAELGTTWPWQENTYLHLVEAVVAVEYNMQSGLRTNWKIYRKEILKEGLKRHNKDKIIIFILANWYVYTKHTHRLEFYM